MVSRLVGVALLAVLVVQVGCATAPVDSRQFSIRYEVNVTDVPADTEQLRIWVPVPDDDNYQDISNLSFEPTDQNMSINTESTYSNQIACITIDKPTGDVQLAMSFDVSRLENTAGAPADRDTDKLSFATKPNKLVPINDETRAEATGIAVAVKDPADLPRAVYDYVLDRMAYDKSGIGWGRGDYQHACTIGRGNCTDYHAYFIALCRSLDIPAYFEIGLSVPSDKPAGTTGGYHCWAYFWNGVRWVPVDISEADKDPTKTDYFFGNHDTNRVAMSIGRDLELVPAQQGPPLNFLLNPYVEADGKPHDAVTKTCHYEDKL